MADEQYTTEVEDTMNIAKLKVPDLRRELKARGLNTTGNKMELAQRLTEAIQSGKNDDGSADSVDELIDEDDVLNDDEIEQEVGNLNTTEVEVSDRTFEAENTNNAKPVKRKSFESTTSDSGKNGKSAKKIVLNRELSSDTHSESNATTNNTTNGDTESKKVIKFSELSAKERLEMRAKKFGVPLSTEAKKVVRAQRFGDKTTATTTGTITLGNNLAAPASLDLLKKRAERFGTVSTQLKKVEVEENLEKRKARFGSESNSTTNNDTQKARRLERFKTGLK